LAKTADELPLFKSLSAFYSAVLQYVGHIQCLGSTAKLPGVLEFGFCSLIWF